MTGRVRTGPRYPRLLRGVVLAEADCGLVVEGGPRRRLLTGHAAGLSWRELLPLLDGAHSIDHCAAELGVAHDAVTAAVRTLDDGDLIEAGPGPGAAGASDDSASDDDDHAVAEFLSRSVTVTRRHANGQLAVRALRDCAVIIAAPPPLAAVIDADARATGIGTVLMRAGAAAVTAQDIELACAARPRCVVAVWDGPGEGAALRRLERSCAAARIPLLRFACPPGAIEVGPLFLADFTSCYSCFADGYAAQVTSVDEQPAQRPDDQVPWLAAALVLHEVLAVTAQLTDVDSFRRLTVLTLDESLQRRLLVTRRPGCPDCAAGQPQPGPAARAADAHEWQAESPPPQLRPSRSRSSQAAAVPPPRHGGLLTSPRYALPDAATAPPAAAAPGLDLGALAAVLDRSAGGAPEDAQPDQGNFGSTELLVVAGPGWTAGQGDAAAPASPGLADGGVFWYDSRSRELVLTQRSVTLTPDLLAAVDLPAADADPPLCLLVFVAALRRLVRGQGSLTYRVAHLDAGATASRLSQAAADYGLHARFAADWAERLTELFEVTADMELLVAIAGLYPHQETPEGSVPAWR